MNTCYFVAMTYNYLDTGGLSVITRLETGC